MLGFSQIIVLLGDIHYINLKNKTFKYTYSKREYESAEFKIAAKNTSHLKGNTYRTKKKIIKELGLGPHKYSESESVIQM